MIATRFNSKIEHIAHAFAFLLVVLFSFFLFLPLSSSISLTFFLPLSFSFTFFSFFFSSPSLSLYLYTTYFPSSFLSLTSSLPPHARACVCVCLECRLRIGRFSYSYSAKNVHCFQQQFLVFPFLQNWQFISIQVNSGKSQKCYYFRVYAAALWANAICKSFHCRFELLSVFFTLRHIYGVCKSQQEFSCI